MAKKRAQEAPAPPVSDAARKQLSAGIGFVLLCAAAMSGPTLYGLARRIEFPKELAWLLPAALDGYMFTSIWFGRRVPSAHPVRRAAGRNARLALALTVACNGLYHLIVLGGPLIPMWVRVLLLVAVSSLPPFIIDRLWHLYELASGNRAEAASGATAEAEAEVSGSRKRKAAEAPMEAAAKPSTPESAEAPKASTTARAVSQPSSIAELGQRHRAVRQMVDDAAAHSAEVPLKKIEQRFGVSQTSASRLRAKAVAERDAERRSTAPQPPADADPDEEPEAVYR